MADRAAFLAAAAALAAVPAVVRAQSLTKIRIAAGADGDCIGALWGASSGIFAKYGLDVDVMRLNSGSAVAAAVAGGSIDIGKSSVFNMITAHSKGIPFFIEAPCTLYLAGAPDFGRPIDALGKRMVVTVYFCSVDFAQKNADALVRFRKGLNEAAAYALAHRSQMIPTDVTVYT